MSDAAQTLRVVIPLAVKPRGGRKAVVTPGVLALSCTRFLWTPICPRRDRKDEVQHEADRRPFGR